MAARAAVPDTVGTESVEKYILAAPDELVYVVPATLNREDVVIPVPEIEAIDTPRPPFALAAPVATRVPPTVAFDVTAKVD